MNPPATAATPPLLDSPQNGSRPACQPAAIARRLDELCRRYRLLVFAITVLCLVAGAAPGLLMAAYPPLPAARALYTLAALAAVVAATIAAPHSSPERARRRPSIASLPRSSHGSERESV